MENKEEVQINKLHDDAFYEEIAQKLEEKCKERHARDFYERLQKMPSFFAKLHEIAKQEKIKNPEYKKFDMDLAHMQTMALDFFHSLDEELCESVWNVLEDTENTTLFVKKPSEEGGKNSVCVITDEKKWKNSSRTLKKFRLEISLAPTNDTLGLCTVAHELAHTMEESSQKLIPQNVGALSEIVAMFMERIYADHLVSIGKIDKEERDKFFANIQNTFIDNARTVLIENAILSEIPSPIRAKDLKALDEKYDGKPEHERIWNCIKNMTDGFHGQEHYGERQLRYVFGELACKELYKDFQKEPEKTIEKLKGFAQQNAHLTASEGFEMLLGENCYERMGLKIGKTKI